METTACCEVWRMHLFTQMFMEHQSCDKHKSGLLGYISVQKGWRSLPCLSEYVVLCVLVKSLLTTPISLSLWGFMGSYCWNTRDTEGMVLLWRKWRSSWSCQIQGLVHQSSSSFWYREKWGVRGRPCPRSQASPWDAPRQVKVLGFTQERIQEWATVGRR